MVCVETVTFEPTAPFSLELSSQIFCAGDKQVRSYADGTFQQVIRAGANLVLAKLISQGTLQHPQLRLTIESNSPLQPQEKLQAIGAIKYIFNLDFDLNAFYREVANDHAMSQITRQLCGFKFPTTPTVFESLVDSIVEQQISIKVARTIEERLAKKFGDQLILDGTPYFAFPTPQNLIAASISEIQSVGLSQRKAQYIENAACLIVNGKLDLEGMKSQRDPEIIIAELDRLKGIGVWTAELTMLRGMQHWDALPADDFGIRRVISTYYCGGKPIKTADARGIAEAWGTWKGLAAFYLILAEVRGIVV